MSHSLRHKLTLLAAATLAAAPAFGVEYLITPRLDQLYSFDDNLQLTGERNTIEAHMYQITAAAELRARGDTWGLSGNGLVQASRFDDDAFDSDNQQGNLSLQRFGERSLLQMDVGIVRQAQRSAELDGSGLLGIEATRVERVTARPVAQIQLSERYQLTLGGSFTNQHFESLLFRDYESLGFDVALTRQISDRTAVDVTIFGSEFETEAQNNENCSISLTFLNGQLVPIQQCSFFGRRRESTTLGLQFGFRHALSDRFELRASLGGRDVESRDILGDILTDCVFSVDLSVLLEPCTPIDDVSNADTSTGVVASTNLSYQSKRFSYTLGFERAVSPLSLGFLIESDRFDASARYRLKEKLTAVTNINYQTSESTTSAVVFDRSFVSVAASLDWRITQSWRVAPGVRWREQETSFADVAFDSFSVFVNLNYRPKKIQFSR